MRFAEDEVPELRATTARARGSAIRVHSHWLSRWLPTLIEKIQNPLAEGERTPVFGVTRRDHRSRSRFLRGCGAKRNIARLAPPRKPMVYRAAMLTEFEFWTMKQGGDGLTRISVSVSGQEEA